MSCAGSFCPLSDSVTPAMPRGNSLPGWDGGHQPHTEPARVMGLLWAHSGRHRCQVMNKWAVKKGSGQLSRWLAVQGGEQTFYLLLPKERISPEPLQRRLTGCQSSRGRKVGQAQDRGVCFWK